MPWPGVCRLSLAGVSALVELGERQIAWDKKFKEGRGEELSDSLMDHLSLKSDGRSGASLASGKLRVLHQGVEKSGKQGTTFMYQLTTEAFGKRFTM